MDSEDYSLLNDLRINRTRAKPSAGRRAASAALVVLLHGLLVAFLLMGNPNAFSVANSTGTAGSGSMVVVSLYSDARHELPVNKQAVSSPVAPMDEKRQHQIHDPAPAPQAITTPDLSVASDNGSPGQQSIIKPEAGIGASADAASEFQKRLLAHIETYREYPDAAKRGRLEGVVELLFAMDRNGAVLGVWIKRSSGFPALDKEAIATVLRAQPLPPFRRNCQTR